MCMHQLKYARLNRKDRVKNMRGTTQEVTMLADVRVISNVLQCVTGPLLHEPSSLPLEMLDFDWSVKHQWRGP